MHHYLNRNPRQRNSIDSVVLSVTDYMVPRC